MSGDVLDRLEELIVELIKRYRALKRENEMLLKKLDDAERKKALAIDRLRKLAAIMEEYEKKG